MSPQSHFINIPTFYLCFKLNANLYQDHSAGVAITVVKINIHLLLSQDQHSLWFDGMVRCQILSTAPHHSVLEGFPHPVTGGPRDAEVMPFSIVDEERQLCDLWQRCCKNHVFLSS